MKEKVNKMQHSAAKPPNKRRKHNPAETVEQVGVSGPTEPNPRLSIKRGKAGKLSGLLDLPIDLLFEIFGQLRPYDLLRLSRMTKEFRRVLMHRSSISVWKAALESVPGLPSCPEDMSEPQWVNLTFDPHCHFCFTTGVRVVEWALRVRICSKCAKDQIIESSCFSVSDDDLESLIPSRPAKRMRRGFLERDYIAMMNKFGSIKDMEAKKAFVIKQRQRLVDINQHAAKCSTWANSQNLERGLELQQLRDDRRLAIIERLEALGWGKDILSIEYPDSLDDHKLVKRPQRLTDSIWNRIQGPILEFMSDMRTKRLARERAKLILERKNIAAQVLRTYKNACLPYIEVMPERLDFSEFPPIKAILELPTERNVEESSFDGVIEQIPGLIEEWRTSLIQQLIQTMRNDEVNVQQENLFKMMSSWGEDEGDFPQAESSASTETDEELLIKMKLATTVFQCSHCTKRKDLDLDDSLPSSDEWYGSDTSLMAVKVVPLFYPEVLGHSCLTRSPHRFWSWGHRLDACRRLDSMNKIRRKWTARPLRVDRTLGSCAASVVTAAGLDPATTTAVEMDQLDLMFGCLKCATILQGCASVRTRAYGWRDAVAHHTEQHCYSTSKWKVLTPQDLGEVRVPDNEEVNSYPASTLESESNIDLSILPSLTLAGEANWLCVHCRDLPSEIEGCDIVSVGFHIQSKHNITKPEINKDFYREFHPHPLSPISPEVILSLDVLKELD